MENTHSVAQPTFPLYHTPVTMDIGKCTNIPEPNAGGMPARRSNLYLKETKLGSLLRKIKY